MFRQLIFSILITVAATLFPFSASGQKVVTAAQVNGTWREVSSKPASVTTEVWIWALGGQQLQVEFSANNAAKKFSNTAVGIIRIEGTTATFKPEEGQSDENKPCIMTLNFNGSSLKVTEKGECGWGAGVTAEGTYKKISSKKPQFDTQ